jgi:hypothetical protein
MEPAMINALKIIVLMLSALLSLPSCAGESKRIEEIQARFSTWQPIIKSEQKSAAVIYRYAWGHNFEKEEWSSKPIKSDEKRLAEKVALIKNKIGSWVYKENSSFSGDWIIASEHYYDEEGKLFFVFWKMNTFQAEEPVTVEKRLYFDKQGKVVRNLVAVYKMNTKQETKASFMDREVAYETSFSKQDFLKHLR